METALNTQNVKLTPSDFFLLANPSNALQNDFIVPVQYLKHVFPTTICSPQKFRGVKHSAAFLDLVIALAMIPH